MLATIAVGADFLITGVTPATGKHTIRPVWTGQTGQGRASDSLLFLIAEATTPVRRRASSRPARSRKATAARKKELPARSTSGQPYPCWASGPHQMGATQTRTATASAHHGPPRGRSDPRASQARAGTIHT